jgi:hypothetical protein
VAKLETLAHDPRLSTVLRYADVVGAALEVSGISAVAEDESDRLAAVCA